MSKSKPKNDSGVADQFDPHASKGKKEDTKPQPEEKEELKKKAFKQGQGDNDDADTPESKKYPHR